MRLRSTSSHAERVAGPARRGTDCRQPRTVRGRLEAQWLVPSVRQKANDQIVESVSAWWSVSPQAMAARGIEHVAALHRGVTRAVFKIDPESWETRIMGPTRTEGRPGSQPSCSKPSAPDRYSTRSSARMATASPHWKKGRKTHLLLAPPIAAKG